MRLFTDRSGAGRQLADRLGDYSCRDDVVVLAIPRGGVPVGYEIARLLNLPLDVVVVRRVRVPGAQVSLAAVGPGDVIAFDDSVAARTAVRPAELERAIEMERVELKRREKAWRGTNDPCAVRGKTVIIVDDGVISGTTMRAAVQAARRAGAKRIIAAVPVGSCDAIMRMHAFTDSVVCLTTGRDVRALSLWYVDFEGIGDEKIREYLTRAQQVAQLVH